MKEKEKNVSMDKSTLSMHENVNPWCVYDTCSAEDYWLEMAEKLDIDLED